MTTGWNPVWQKIDPMYLVDLFTSNYDISWNVWETNNLDEEVRFEFLSGDMLHWFRTPIEEDSRRSNQSSVLLKDGKVKNNKYMKNVILNCSD